MAASLQSKLGKLEAFLSGYPDIVLSKPDSDSFASLKETYIIDNPAIPLGIVRPQSAEDVAGLVRFCTEHDTQFVVRSGGNQIFGLSCVQNVSVKPFHTHVDSDDRDARPS